MSTKQKLIEEAGKLVQKADLTKDAYKKYMNRFYLYLDDHAINHLNEQELKQDIAGKEAIPDYHAAIFLSLSVLTRNGGGGGDGDSSGKSIWQILLKIVAVIFLLALGFSLYLIRDPQIFTSQKHIREIAYIITALSGTIAFAIAVNTWLKNRK